MLRVVQHLIGDPRRHNHLNHFVLLLLLLLALLNHLLTTKDHLRLHWDDL